MERRAHLVHELRPKTRDVGVGRQARQHVELVLKRVAGGGSGQPKVEHEFQGKELHGTRQAFAQALGGKHDAVLTRRYAPDKLKILGSAA